MQRPAISSETGHCRSHRLSPARLLCSTALASGVLLAAGAAFANPSGGQVVGGNASISQAPGVTTIDQKSNKAIINWQGFSIAPGELTRFNQPGRDAIALNRVRGNERSDLLGRLEASGNVWLINPNGVLVGPQAKVDVGGFLATTADIRDADFFAGRFDFAIPSPNTEAVVVNQGTISLKDAGMAALVAPHARNEGVIQGTLAQVVVAGVPTFTVDFYGDGLISFQATSQVTAVADPDQPLVDNSGTIRADGGRVLLTADAAAGVVEKVIDMSGVIEARSFAMNGGEIVLDGHDSGIVAVAGTLDAAGSDTGERGGTVKVLGEKVGLFDGAQITVAGDAGGGTALIGGNFQGKGAERNAKRTYVAKNATVSADATTNGDGGKVIVWADDVTRFDGTISARGGAISGNGGFVEVSGHNALAYNGSTDLRAPHGSFGTLLLDPNDVTIQVDEGDTNITGDGLNTPFTTTGDDAILTPESIREALALGNVVIQTGSAGENSQLGNITINSTISASDSGGDLTLQAVNDIVLNSQGDNPAVDMGAASGNLVLRADADSSGAGSIALLSGAGIVMGTGGLVLEAATGIGSLGSPIVTTGAATLSALNTTLGDIEVRNIGGGPLSIGSVAGVSGVTNNGGSVAIQNSGPLVVEQPINASGDISLTTVDPDNWQAGITQQANVIAGGSINFSSDGPIQQQADLTASGNINLYTFDPVNWQASITQDAKVMAGGDINLVSRGSIQQQADMTASGNINLITYDNLERQQSDIVLQGAIVASGQVELFPDGSIFQTAGAGITAPTLLLLPARNFARDAVLTGDNQVGALSAPDLGDIFVPFNFITMNNASDVTINGIVAGSVDLRTQGRLTVDQPIITTGDGTPILLVTNGFTNNAGAVGLQPGTGRFLVYSVDPANDQTGGLVGEVRRDSSFASVPPDSPTLTAGTSFFLYQVASPPPPPPPPPELKVPQTIPPSVVNPTLSDSDVRPSVITSPATAPEAIVATAPAQQHLLPQAQPAWGQKDEDLLYSNDGNRELWGIADIPLPAGTTR